jgi:hypothetical protein
LGDGVLEGAGSEFLEGVDLASSGPVSEVDAVVLHGGHISLVNLLDFDDLSLGALELVQLSVQLPSVNSLLPKLGFSEILVLREDSEADNLRVWILLIWESSTVYDILVDVHLSGCINGLWHC